MPGSHAVNISARLKRTEAAAANALTPGTTAGWLKGGEAAQAVERMVYSDARHPMPTLE